jgi:hypothetical protein
MKRLARLVAVLGAVGVGWLLLGDRPRDVELVYDLSEVPEAAELRIAIGRGPTRLREARFPNPGARARHRVRLTDGEYVLAWSLDGPAGSLRGDRPLEVSGEQTIVLRLAP